MQQALNTLSINKGQIATIITTVDELDSRAYSSELYADANLSDDKTRSVLDDLPGDEVFNRPPQDRVHNELLQELDELPRDAQVDLVVLLWIGQGDIEPDELNKAREKAENLNEDQIKHLLAITPLLSKHLKKALFITNFS